MKTKLFFLTALAAFLLMAGCHQPINNGGLDENGNPINDFRIVAPEEPSVISGDHQITVIVTEVATAIGYEVWYGTAPTPTLAVLWPGGVTIEGRKISAVITGLEYDVTYFVWLKAIFPAGISDFSIAGSGIPLPMPGPPGGASVSGGDTNLTVTWSSASNATSYDIFYSTSGGSEPPVNAGKNTTSALKTVINGLTNGTNYTVWVRAANSAGVSGFTTGSGSPHAVSASSPGSITTVTGGNKKLTLTWPWTAGVYGYAVYSNTANNFSTAVKKLDNVLPTGDTITAVVTGLTNGTTYYVWVVGKTSTGTEASPSTVDSGTPNPKPAIDYSNPGLVIGTAAARFINEEAANSDRLSRKKETALGDLVTEGLAWWARDNAHTIDFAFLNGGIITGALPVGPITVGAVKKILPYNEDTVTILTLTGSQVTTLFNYVSKVRHDGGGGSGTGAWGMVSKEIRYILDYTLTADGSGVLQNLTFNNAAINPAGTYRIATSDYLYTGGDGYGAYLGGGTNVIRTGIPITKAVCEYIHDQDAPLVPSTDGRVTLIGGVVK